MTVYTGQQTNNLNATHQVLDLVPAIEQFVSKDRGLSKYSEPSHITAALEDVSGGGVANGESSYAHFKANLNNHFLKIKAENRNFSLSAIKGDKTESIPEVALEAAFIAGAIASTKDGFKTYMTKKQLSANPERSTDTLSFGNGTTSATRSSMITQALESYSNQPVNESVNLSMAYNLGSAIQSEFNAAFYRPIVLAPNISGFEISVKQPVVNDMPFRSKNGDPFNFNYINLVDAVSNPKLLKNDTNRLYPVYSVQNAKWFADTTLIPPWTVKDHNGNSYQTAALKAKLDSPFDYLGLSTNAALSANGNTDSTDVIDPAQVLEKLYVKFTKAGTGGAPDAVDIILFNLNRMPTTTFVSNNAGGTGQEGTTKQMRCVFSNQLTLSPSTKRLDTSALVALSEVHSLARTVTFDVTFNITSNVDTANYLPLGGTITLNSIRDTNGVIIPASAPEVETLVEILGTAEIIGWYSDTKLSNMNRRLMGQIAQFINRVQPYAIPFHAPVSSIGSTFESDMTVTSDEKLSLLISLTQTRANQNGIDRLLEYEDILNNYHATEDKNGNRPEVFGPGRWFFTPAHFRKPLDLGTIVTNTNSTNLSSDIAAALVNNIVAGARKLMVDSKYLAAIQVFYGNNGPKPIITVGCFSDIAQYIIQSGDLRTAGPELEFKLVTTFNESMRDKILVTINLEEGFNTDNTPPIFYPGVYAYGVELTAELAISRNGQVSNEMIAQPRFENFLITPILGMFEVTGWDDVAARRAFLTETA